MQEDGDTQAAVRSALAEWSGEPALAKILAGSAFLILDDRAERILHVPRSGTLTLPASAGGALPGWLSAEIRRAAGAGQGPRLARLRLDRRRVAAPRLYLLARHEGASPLLILAAADRALPARDGPAPASTEAPASEPEPIAAPIPHLEAPPGAEPPRAGDRFLWRSDGEDAVTALPGRAGGVLAALGGRRWPALAEAGVLREADAFLEAIAARRTFRGLRAVLVPEDGGSLDLELSGTPLARAGRPFEGFGGFGLVCASSSPVAREHSTAMASEDPAPVPAPAAETGPPPETGPRSDGAPAEPRDHRTLAVAVAAFAAAARFGLTWAAGHRPASQPSPQPEAEETPGPAAEAPRVPPEAEGAAALSHAEHDAFREIARALGARYAGDAPGPDEPPAPPESAGGAVMPFPGRTPEAAFLNALPAALLVHRDGAILAASRRLLDLTGHADLGALALDRLFRGAPPEGAAAAQTRSIETADGGGRAVDVEAAAIPWNGAGATCLLLRPVPPVDAEAERTAVTLARAAQAGYAAEARAALDALDDGVVTLDDAGRVVALNRAAAHLLACAPREVVGTPLAALLGSSAADVGPGTDAVIEVAGRALRLRVAPTDLADRRVALLSAPLPPAAPPGLHPAVLAHLARAVRPPLDGILDTADAMLSDEAGPTGSAVRRERLGTIRTSGEQVLGLVGDVSELAAIEAGDHEPARGPLHLNDLVGASVEAVQTQAASGRILLRTSFAPDLPAPEADAATFGRAAQIVIAQAVRRAGAGGQVIVSTMTAEPGTVALRVRDTGTAMAPTEVAALDAFRGGEPFRAGDTPDVPPGTGAALPLARALIEANGGRIRLSSREGEGTLVEILLPARPALHA